MGGRGMASGRLTASSGREWKLVARALRPTRARPHASNPAIRRKKKTIKRSCAEATTLAGVGGGCSAGQGRAGQGKAARGGI